MAGVGFEPGTAPDLRAGVPALARVGGTAGASAFESARVALELVEAVSFDSGAFDSVPGDFGELAGAVAAADAASPAAGCGWVAGGAADPGGAEVSGAELFGTELFGLEVFEPAGAAEELSEPGVDPAP